MPAIAMEFERRILQYKLYCTLYSIYVQILVKNCANSNLNIPIKTEQINRFVFYHLLTYVLVYLANKPDICRGICTNRDRQGFYLEIQIMYQITFCNGTYLQLRTYFIELLVIHYCDVFKMYP